MTQPMPGSSGTSPLNLRWDSADNINLCKDNLNPHKDNLNRLTASLREKDSKLTGLILTTSRSLRHRLNNLLTGQRLHWALVILLLAAPCLVAMLLPLAD